MLTLNMLANALVFPYFDYCSPVWSNCDLKFSNILQILQNKLARVLLSADIRTPVNNLLCDLNWIKLDKRWKIQLLQVVFKCLKNDAPSYLSSQFIFTSTIHSKNTRNQVSNMLVMPSFKIKSGKRTFHYRGSSVWNSIPVDYRCNLSSMKLDSLKPLVTWLLIVLFWSWFWFTVFMLLNFCHHLLNGLLYIYIYIVFFHCKYIVNNSQGLMGDQYCITEMSNPE